jgi:hypothetical protein
MREVQIVFYECKRIEEPLSREGGTDKLSKDSIIEISGPRASHERGRVLDELAAGVGLVRVARLDRLSPRRLVLLFVDVVLVGNEGHVFCTIQTVFQRTASSTSA